MKTIKDLLESLKGESSVDENIAIRFQVKAIDGILTNTQIAEAQEAIRCATVDLEVSTAVEKYELLDEKVKDHAIEVLNEVHWLTILKYDTQE